MISVQGSHSLGEKAVEQSSWSSLTYFSFNDTPNVLYR